MESMEEQKRSSGLILVAIDESTGRNNAFQWALNNQLYDKLNSGMNNHLHSKWKNEVSWKENLRVRYGLKAVDIYRILDFRGHILRTEHKIGKDTCTAKKISNSDRVFLSRYGFVFHCRSTFLILNLYVGGGHEKPWQSQGWNVRFKSIL